MESSDETILTTPAPKLISPQANKNLTYKGFKSNKMQMHKYPAYSQSFFEEEDYSSKDEFHYENSSNMSMMKVDRCPTPPIHAYQPNFSNVIHSGGYATQNHSLDKFSHGGGYASHGHSFDASMNSFTGHTQNSNKFGHSSGYGGYEQGFDKASHGYAGGYGPGFKKFTQGGVSAGYNGQHQASHYGNDPYAHGGGHYQGHGNNYASSMSHSIAMSGGYGAHQGGNMLTGGHCPPAPSWNFKGITD